jgi:hypothetical protein
MKADELTKPSPGFLRKLVGNPDVYAVQRDDGQWTPVREPLTPAVIASHRRGELTVGTYIVNPPDQARTLVFDIDDPKEAEQDRMLNTLCKLLVKLDVQYGVEFSGRKGYHVWVLSDDYMPAEVLYRLGRGIRAEAGFPKLEVFPKQTTVRDMGNLVKLPGGVHRVTGKANDFVGAVPKTNTVEDLGLLAAKYPELRVRSDAPDAIEYPCVYEIQVGAEEGGRNVHLFHLATMLRRWSLTDENVAHIVYAANEKSNPGPLEEWEVERILESSKFSGPICDQLDDSVHCGGQCIKAKHPGLFTRRGALKWAADGEEVVVRVVGRDEDEKHIVEIEHEDIVQGRAILAEPSKPKRRKQSEEDA